MKNDRIVFLDYLRLIACFMVMGVHACEPFYLGGDGVLIASRFDAWWTAALDTTFRCAVPLFVMASAYLQFPLSRPTGEFLRRRFVRVVVPFAIWCVAYTWWFDGRWARLLFNFPEDIIGGHLWYVPMLLGLYLLMPLLSPWAEKASEKEIRGWLLAWLVTTLFPYWRKICGALCGDPSFGSVPFLYGECPWNNGFGMFQYVSGFFGYMLLGFWFRKFRPVQGWGRTLAAAVPIGAFGWCAVALPFLFRIPDGAGYPVKGPYALAVDLEMSWEYCSLGVVALTFAYFSVIRRMTADGAFYRRVVRPLSEASYGTYLLHMFVLDPAFRLISPHFTTPLAILLTAVVSFVLASLISVSIRRIPFVGKWICG